MLLEENKSLAPLTTFGIGGPARWFVKASSEDEVAEAAEWAKARGTTAVCAWRRKQSARLRCRVRWACAACGLARNRRKWTSRPDELSCCSGRRLGQLRGARRERTTARGSNVWRGFREPWAEHRCKMWAPTGKKSLPSSNACAPSTSTRAPSLSSPPRSAALRIAAAGSTPRIAGAIL